MFTLNKDWSVTQWDIASGSIIQSFQEVKKISTNRSIPSACIAITLDHTRVLASGVDFSVVMWQIATGQQISFYLGHQAAVSCVAITPDSKGFISGSLDCTLKLWSFEQPDSAVLTFMNRAPVSCIALSSCGKRMYSGGTNESSIRVWDTNTCRQVALLQSHTKAITSLVVIGSLVVSGSWDKTMKVWQISDNHLVNTLQGHTNWITKLVATEDTVRVVSTSMDRTMCVWNAISGDQLACLRSNIGYSPLTCASVSSDGSLAVSCSSDAVFVWDLSSSNLLSSFKAPVAFAAVLVE
jgi:WD40 repeat protein